VPHLIILQLTYHSNLLRNIYTLLVSGYYFQNLQSKSILQFFNPFLHRYTFIARANSLNPDQLAQMCWLIWIYTGRTRVQKRKGLKAGLQSLDLPNKLALYPTDKAVWANLPSDIRLLVCGRTCRLI
jgi:hypothetical protein